MSDQLVDTNILIHVLAGDLPAGARVAVERIISPGFSVPVITRIEFLG